jgi:uncharacterized membrane protein HdeD (DUF308 family)
MSDEMTETTGRPRFMRIFIHWWLLLVQGIIALILGIALHRYPVETLMVIIVFLGGYWCASAIFTLFSLGLLVVETGMITGVSPGKELSKCIQ